MKRSNKKWNEIIIPDECTGYEISMLEDWNEERKEIIENRNMLLFALKKHLPECIQTFELDVNNGSCFGCEYIKTCELIKRTEGNL